MRYFLIIGALLNLIGGLGIGGSLFINMPFAFPKIEEKESGYPKDYLLFRLFAAGTAFCFASLYLYLYFNIQYAFPFLIFGMSLKYWAFIASLIALRYSKLPKVIFINFGCSNLVVAVLFSIFLIYY